MAKNDRDQLIEKFLSRSRKRRNAGLTSTPNITATRSSFRPLKQATVPSYRPVKRSRKTTY